MVFIVVCAGAILIIVRSWGSILRTDDEFGGFGGFGGYVDELWWITIKIGTSYHPILMNWGDCLILA